MKKPFLILAVVALFAVGGTVALAGGRAASDSAPAAPAAEEKASPKTSPLGEVLAELVADGTITQAQADKIVTALDAKRAERKAAWEAKRAEMKDAFAQLKGFLADGVISADELAQLPAEHPLRNLGSALDDGQITREELRGLRGEGGFGKGWFKGHGFGGHKDQPSKVSDG